MKISDLTGAELGRHAHLTVNGKTYEGRITRIDGQTRPGNDPRLAGYGTPPPTLRVATLHLNTVAWDRIDPDTEIKLLD